MGAFVALSDRGDPLISGGKRLCPLPSGPHLPIREGEQAKVLGYHPIDFAAGQWVGFSSVTFNPGTVCPLTFVTGELQTWHPDPHSSHSHYFECVRPLSVPDTLCELLGYSKKKKKKKKNPILTTT